MDSIIRPSLEWTAIQFSSRNNMDSIVLPLRRNLNTICLQAAEKERGLSRRGICATSPVFTCLNLTNPWKQKGALKTKNLRTTHFTHCNTYKYFYSQHQIFKTVLFSVLLNLPCCGSVFERFPMKSLHMLFHRFLYRTLKHIFQTWIVMRSFAYRFNGP
jgi:hypothetical protein